MTKKTQGKNIPKKIWGEAVDSFTKILSAFAKRNPFYSIAIAFGIIGMALYSLISTISTIIGWIL